MPRTEQPTLDRELTDAVHGAMPDYWRERLTPKDCFRNAFRASGALATIVGRDAVRYVEGYADGLPHGWLETEDGRIVEATAHWLEHPAREYEAIFRYTWDELVEHVSDGGVLPIENIGDSLHHPSETPDEVSDYYRQLAQQEN